MVLRDRFMANMNNYDIKNWKMPIIERPLAKLTETINTLEINGAFLEKLDTVLNPLVIPGKSSDARTALGTPRAFAEIESFEAAAEGAPTTQSVSHTVQSQRRKNPKAGLARTNKPKAERTESEEQEETETETDVTTFLKENGETDASSDQDGAVQVSGEEPDREQLEASADTEPIDSPAEPTEASQSLPETSSSHSPEIAR